MSGVILFIPDVIPEDLCRQIVQGGDANERPSENHSDGLCWQFRDGELAAIVYRAVALHSMFLTYHPHTVHDRFIRYETRAGGSFRAHRDSRVRIHHEPADLISTYTALIYLNENFEGGWTFFPDALRSVVPRMGGLLLFDQTLVHYGATVTRGIKHTIRGDVLSLKELPC